MDQAPGSAQIEVYLLDDHEVVRRGVRDLLEAEDDIVVVGEASTAEEAVLQIPRLRPDIAIVDNRLPDGSGIDVCREVRSQDPGLAVLFLTSFDDDDAIFAAILAGAAGYLLKQVRAAALVAGVRQVAAGQSLLDPSVTARVLNRIREGKQEDARLASLNAQERKILLLIAEGLTNRQIAQRLVISERTAQNHVQHILTKLGFATRGQVAAWRMSSQ